ncbi:MAG: GIY-YIG nuclease family protein [Candidatus Sungbacteria bacterium]|uniref:GIY-YIG nuclease family protein n=1 Tax=Candidatus Sungiibacteriota bacterium TaxID=2750080 RepID=A0A933DT44_9BACT|nr:GIY-YIG nuclease family protein [Candidatus Sungbacteria bacterium]
MYYLYLIRNRKTKKFYIGYTDDLKRRIKEHRGKSPELIYYEAYKSEKDARNRESKLKQRGQSIRRLKARLYYSITS